MNTTKGVKTMTKLRNKLDKLISNNKLETLKKFGFEEFEHKAKERGVIQTLYKDELRTIKIKKVLIKKGFEEFFLIGEIKLYNSIQQVFISNKNKLNKWSFIY
jgi:predicted transcriptional regulator